MSLAKKMATQAEELEDQLHKRSEELKKAKQDLTAARENIQEQASNVRKLRIEHEETQTRLRDATERSDKLREENTAAQVRIAELEADNRKLDVALAEKRAELDKDKAYFFEQMERWEEKAKAQQNELKRLSSQKDAKAQSAREMTSDLETEVADLEKQKEELEARLVELTGMSILQNELDDLKAKHALTEKELQEQRAEAKISAMRVSELEEELEAAEREVSRSATGNSARRAELEESFRTSNEALKLSVAEKEEELELSQHELRDLRKQLQKSNDHAKQLEERIEEQSSQFELAESEHLAALDRKSARINELEEELEAAEHEVSRSVAGNDAQRDELEENFRASNEALKNTIAEKEEELELSQHELRDLKKQLQKANDRAKQLEERIEEQASQFELAESQRVAALDGETAAMLAAEREKVQQQEQRKAQEDIDQLILDQRQAMEALVMAVRAEEEMKYKSLWQAEEKLRARGLLTRFGSDPVGLGSIRSDLAVNQSLLEQLAYRDD
ncbi:Hypothetical Protein FCC1311_033082 [Hondaea fermentalgiana]|uniref:Uncharacterized protein n=1 Tax=Hondaea fermentalgiana TaxID=2315210 RepID=A0A2R5G977_9STRA|nr:Hypothetical Protein FCC1311_033082 [Hondaea fermentalgiana]|eukprot:GBG27085.1 Hypothetical Protein FCC1311_033082 [Hondaea fermentalgiana]